MKKGMSKRVISLVALATMLGSTTTLAATKPNVKKEEIVFVNLDSNGEKNKITVSDWLHGDSKSLNIDDVSELDNIKNVKTDDKPEVSGKNLSWNVDSSDIYYQGTTDKELPLEVSVKYYLDGKAMQPEKLVGKSGKLKIEYEINNKSFSFKEVNGEKKKIYTPFSTATIFTLPIDIFKSVTTDGGIMLSEGNNNIITFASFPGLEESLGVGDIDLGVNLTNKLTINAEVKNFSMSPIMVTATSELPNIDSLNEASTLDELKSSLQELKDASSKLVEGSSKLDTGIQTAFSKLSSGISVVNTSEVQSGINMLNDADKMFLANKLLSDAFYAQKLDTTKAKQLLNFITDENVAKISKMTGNLQLLNKYKALMKGSLTTVNKLSSDPNFNKLLEDVTTLETIYSNTSDETKAKISNLLKLGSTENLLMAQGLLNEVNSVKDDFSNVNDTINYMISQTPGSNSQEQAYNFVNGLKDSLAVTQNLLSDETSTALNSLSNDLTSYASSYLILKAQLAAAYQMQGEAGFVTTKEQLKTYVNAVFATSNKEGVANLIAFIDSITPDQLTAENITNDVYKINSYGTNLPSLIQGMNSLKQMKPLIDACYSSFSKEGEVEKVTKLLGDLNNENTQKLLDAFGNSLLSFSSEEIVEISQMLSGLDELTSQLATNKANLESCKALLNAASEQKDLLTDLNTLTESLDQIDSLVNDMQTNLGGLDQNNISEIRNISNNLFSMQQDLVDGNEILLLLQNAIQDKNVERIKSLIKSIPTLQEGLKELSSGSTQLKEGMEKFNEEGINVLYTKGEDGFSKVDDLLASKDALVEASNDYDNFAGKNEDMDGNVKFVMKTDQIKAEEKSKSKNSHTDEDKKTGIIEWIKSLF